MEYFEITITVLLKDNIHFSKSSEMIGKIISKSMLKDIKLKELHSKSQYKYLFNNLYPIESDGIYKKNRIYVFNIRFFNEEYIIRMKEQVSRFEDSYIKVISTDLNIIRKKPIFYIETITPAIVTVDSKPWIASMDIFLLVKRLHDNAEKKYKFFFDERVKNIDDYFIEKLKILNRKPIAYKYKEIKLLGNKFRIKVNEDEVSQKLAFTVMGAGLAEKNSILGAGYCKCDWR